MGRQLAGELEEELAVGVLGNDVDGSAREALSFGADKVYAVAHPLLESYQVDLHLAALDRLCRDIAPAWCCWAARS